MENSKLKVGIVGLGVGEAHIEGYHSHPQAQVTMLCDFCPQKMSMAKEKYPQMQVVENATQILTNPEIDVVSIASYDNFHFEQIQTAIDHGKHIFVEKPLCLFAEEATNIRKKLNENPHIKMSSNLILRKSPRFIDLKQRISQGELGEIFCVEGDYNYGRLHKITEGWRGELDFYSVIHGGGVHIVDLIMWLTQKKITKVAAMGTRISVKDSKFKFNDTVISIATFEDGSIGKISANFSCVYPHFHRLSIYGTNATFVNGIDQAQYYETRDPQTPPTLIDTKYPGVHKGDLIYSFIEAIVKDTSPEVSKDDILDAMSVCFAIEKASHLQQSVDVEYI